MAVARLAWRGSWCVHMCMQLRMYTGTNMCVEISLYVHTESELAPATIYT